MMQNQTATQEPSAKTFQCSQCVLVFKSKPYLFEHLTKVHGCNVESALTFAHLKSPYSCLDCTFKHSDWSVFTKHKKECPVSSRPKEDGKGVSHTKTKRTVNSTKNPKKYKKPSQTITKFFSPLSESNVTFLEKDSPVSVDSSKGTLVLEESSSKSKPHSSGVFTVTAKSIDINTRGTFHNLLSDNLFNSDVTNPNPAEQTAPPNAGKRTVKESSTSPPAKQAKMGKVAIYHPETAIKNLTFEVSEDEMEEKDDLVNGNVEDSTSYSCKHCDYSDGDIKRMCTHYMNNHPYVRYNWDYIKEPSDHSATFRCLECPVEFSCVTDLSKHYKKGHPEAQNIMTVKTCELRMVFKCFVCLFTSGSQKNLKEHHKEMHPKYKVENPLMYCRYSSTSQTLQLRTPEKYSSERSAGISTRALCKEDKNIDRHPSRQADNVTYKCNNCTFSHKSVVVLHVHYKRTHPDQEITLDKIKQSICVASPTSGQLRPVDAVSLTPPKDKTQFFKGSKNKVKSPQPKISSSLANPKHLRVASNANSESPKSNKVAMTESNPYACAADLFYCQFCNYGNPTVQGILNHQIKSHSKMHATSEGIVKHTALIRDEMKKSKREAMDPYFSSGLPLPIIKHGDKDLLFCHLCNYRHTDPTRVMHHYLKFHHDVRITSKQVRLYSAAILEKVQKTSHARKGNQKKTSKKSFRSFPFSTSASKMQRTLQCQHCLYATQHLYLLRRHLQKIHMIKYTAGDVLKLCCQQGTLQPGYHCDMCVFSSKHVVQLQDHFRERHLKYNRSMEYISQLYFDPKMCSSTKKTAKTKQRDGQRDCDDPGSSLQLQRSAQQDCKIYSCRACSFRGTSVSSIKCHYRAVHPWAVKEDGSVLDVIDSKEQSENLQLEDGSRFETYQVPLEFENLPSSPHEETAVFECPHCSASFSSHRGLEVHCGMKHQATSPVKVKEPRVQNNKRVHIFTCLHCAYVNTRYHGVLTHIQMKHPNLGAKADSLYVYIEHLKNVKMGAPGDKLKFSGYRCEKCQHIFPSRDTLDKHNKNEHGKPPVKLKLKLTPLVVDDVPSSHSTRESVMKAVSDEDNEFKCVLCTSSYIAASRLGIHYSKKHGKEAFLKFYVPIYGQKSKKPTPSSPNCSATEVSSTVEDCVQKLVYKCTCCPYVNASYHGTLTHMQMKHPRVEAKADNLRKVEILTSDLVGCNLGKAENERGYLCKNCPQIHPTMKRLKIHMEKEHKHGLPATSEHSAETQPPAVSKDHSSVLGSGLSTKKTSTLAKSTYSCSLCTYSTLMRKRLGNHYIQRHGKSAYLKLFAPLYYNFHKHKNVVLAVKENAENTPKTTTPPVQEATYNCQMCSYIATHRRYLRSHYRKKHKLDLHTVCKLLQKYNRYGRKNLKAGSENSAQVKCKECPNLFFELSEQLITHYSTFHRSQYILDFKVLSKRSRKSTGTFRCGHCHKKIHGIKNLHQHLDRHTAWKKKNVNAAKMTSATDATTVELITTDELPALETMEEFAQSNAKQFETSAAESSVAASPPSVTDLEPPEMQTSGDKNTCKHCKRSFMSLKGLRSHERSHAALAGLKKLDKLSSAAKHRMENYLIYKTGVQKPLMCSICSYRTAVMGLWKCHMIKKHLDIIDGSSNTGTQDEESIQSFNKDPLYVFEEMNLPESDEETKDVLYLEPPDVQRQLNHYHWMAQVGSSSKASLQKSQQPVSGLLNCEFCSFNSGHQSSMRRHYLHRHGKKIIRCKDCNFFSGSRKNLERHMAMGHCTLQSRPTQQKDFRCPFCLYQSKNKNNMIDHIVLHREERVMPIQMRRPKLSRYLQGIVFRCHKCTFSSASAENLRVHLMKHDDIKPFRCRLCYFDCCRLCDLEAHLCDKHQVVRNHELVGQVSLEKLSTQISRTSEEEEEEEEEEEDVLGNLETEAKFVEACNELPDDTKDNSMVEIEHSYYKKEGSQSESCVLELSFGDDSKESTAVEEMSERVEVSGITQTKNREGIQGTVQNGTNPESEDPAKDGQKDENKHQPKLSGIEEETVQQKDKAAEESSSSCVELHGKDVQMHDKTRGDGSQNILAKMEDDLLREAFSQDKDGNGSKTDKKPVQDKKAVIKDNGLNLDKASIALSLKSCTVPLFSSKHLLNDVKLPNKRSSGASVTVCKNEQTQDPDKDDQPMDVYGEMPVLENEYLKEEMPHLRHFTEVSQSCVEDTDEDDVPRCHAENQLTDERNTGEDAMKEVEIQSVPEGGFADTKVEVEGLSSPSTEEKLSTCDLCGRSFDNRSELERHILRHGM